MYVTASPCIECAKLIIQAGIKRVVYSEHYRLEDGIELLKRAGIEVIYTEMNEDFGSDVKKQFFQKRIKGRGYCDVGTSVISEFYTPLVPKGHDFLQTIGSLAQARQDGTATCEAKGDGTD